jgi:hypothetical protein
LDEKQDYSSLYRLTCVTDQVFQLALEDWASRQCWESAFKVGRTDRKTHPALPGDAARNWQIQSLFADQLKTDPKNDIKRSGRFLNLTPAKIRCGALIDLFVSWSELADAFVAPRGSKAAAPCAD